MRLWIFAVGHVRGTPEGALSEDFCDRARKHGPQHGLLRRGGGGIAGLQGTRRRKRA